MTIKVVLDTNVFISGIFWEGNFSSQIINLWRNNKIDLVSSIPIIEELIKNLKGFKIKMSDELVEGWKNMIFENAIMVSPTKNFNVIKEDPDDNKFIEAAVAGQAQFIVTQDKHLLKLKEFQGIKILTPKEMLHSML